MALPSLFIENQNVLVQTNQTKKKLNTKNFNKEKRGAEPAIATVRPEGEADKM